MAMTADGLSDRIGACVEAADFRGLTALYRPDTLFDANVPYWRFQVRGAAAALRIVEEEMASIQRPRVAESRRTPTGDGLVVETEVRFEQEGEERLWRDVHVIHTDGKNITEHSYYCTGNWDAATIRRQADEAPMVRRGAGAIG